MPIDFQQLKDFAQRLQAAAQQDPHTYEPLLERTTALLERAMQPQMSGHMPVQAGQGDRMASNQLGRVMMTSDYGQPKLDPEAMYQPPGGDEAPLQPPSSLEAILGGGAVGGLTQPAHKGIPGTSFGDYFGGEEIRKAQRVNEPWRVADKPGVKPLGFNSDGSPFYPADNLGVGNPLTSYLNELSGQKPSKTALGSEALGTVLNYGAVPMAKAIGKPLEDLNPFPTNKELGAGYVKGTGKFNPPNIAIGDTTGLDNLYEGDTVAHPVDLYNAAKDPRFYPGYSAFGVEGSNNSAPSDQAASGPGAVGPTPFSGEEKGPTSHSQDWGLGDFLGLLAGGKNFLDYKSRDDNRRASEAMADKHFNANQDQHKMDREADRKLRSDSIDVDFFKASQKADIESENRDQRQEGNIVRATGSSMNPKEFMETPIYKQQMAEIQAKKDARYRALQEREEKNMSKKPGKTEIKK